MKQHESGIEKYYSGDEAWRGYVLFCRPIWEQCTFAEDLVLKLGGDLDLAQVIYQRHPKPSCLVWIEQPIPALENRSILYCISHGLDNRVREMLLRMP